MTPEQLIFLRSSLGALLTSYLAEATATVEVQEWIDDGSVPDERIERRLAVVYDVVNKLSDKESNFTIQTWFIGANPYLDNVAPARFVRHGGDLDELRKAASEFLSA